MLRYPSLLTVVLFSHTLFSVCGSSQDIFSRTQQMLLTCSVPENMTLAMRTEQMLASQTVHVYKY